MEGWQPIETAPKDRTDILVHFPEYDHAKNAVVYWEERCWATPHGGIVLVGATHWMPLPEPPVE